MQPFQIFKSYPNARAFFAAVRKAVGELAYWQTVEREGADAIAPSSSGGGSGVSDPTANRAIWLADNDERARKKACREIRRCETLIGVGLVVIDSVREKLGERYADALEDHYIDGMSYRGIAEGEGVTRSAIKLRCSVALDWLDSQPLTRIFNS